MIHRRLAATLFAGAIAFGTLTACGSDDDSSTTLEVYAAASLRGSFEKIATAFEAEHKDVEVKFNFAGSSELVSQLTQGADADVLATADEKTMGQATDAELLSAPAQIFAGNTLRIVVPAGNPKKISNLADLSKGVDLVICAPQVPCGAASVQVAEAAGITLQPVSEELNVTEVLSKVTNGQADAGLVYLTDVISAGDAVEGIEFPESQDVINRYPIGRLEESDEDDLADAFVAFVASSAGQQILADAGFQAP
ncbi:molybdate ABC transporter substrate-binding protein [Nocardioides sp. Bht2]|uniref:molybdate ABC transporter substrate-binding protein n=1 Tax=Nocardioides sp. Bht2 TaxID=3392297 RepID=UPI0039B698EA